MDAWTSVEADAFSRHMHEIHDDIQQKFVLSHENYKAYADVTRKFSEFMESDMVMVWIRPKQYPRGVYKKLHSKNDDAYKILKKISSNAYVLGLPENMGISNIFNIENLTPDSDPKATTSINDPNAHLPPAPWLLKEKIEDVVDHQILSTGAGC